MSKQTVFNIIGDKHAAIVRAASMMLRQAVNAADLQSCGLSKRMADDYIRSIKANGGEPDGQGRWRVPVSPALAPSLSLDDLINAAADRAQVSRPFSSLNDRDRASVLELGASEELLAEALDLFYGSDYWSERGFPPSAFAAQAAELLDKANAARAKKARAGDDRRARTLAAWRLAYCNKHGASSWTPEVEAKHAAYFDSQEP